MNVTNFAICIHTADLFLQVQSQSLHRPCIVQRSRGQQLYNIYVVFVYCDIFNGAQRKGLIQKDFSFRYSDASEGH